MTVQLAPAPVFQGSGFGGLPLPFGQLFTYIAGTTTPQATYVDSTQTTQNLNPVILNASGQASVWLVIGQTYKLVLQDSFGNTVWTQDQVAGGINLTSLLAILTQTVLGGILYPPTAQEAGLTLVNLWYPPGNVLRYGTNSMPGTTDMSLAIQNACNQCAVQGGAAVFFPAGTYLVNTTITITSPQQALHLRGDGENIAVIVKNGDSDLFAFTATGVVNVPAMFVIESLRIGTSTAMVTGAAFRLQCTTLIPSVVMRDVFIINAGTFTYAFGVVTTDCNEAFYENVKMYGLGSTGVFVGWNIISAGAGAPSNKFIGCSVANAKYGVYILNNFNPGIEGTQFYGCDFYFVNTGVLAINTVGGYVPPGITWIGGHINATFKNFDLRIFTQITIQGGLFYNTDNTGLGAIVGITTCGDLNIQGNLMYGGTAANVILMSYSSSTNGGIIANNVAYVDAAHSFISTGFSNIVNMTIANNVQNGGALTINNTGGTIAKSVKIINNTPDQLDIYDSTLTATATMSLIGIRAPYLLVGTPGGAITVTVLTSRGANDEVTLISASNLITIQHNGTNPDGFSLQGAVNFTFGAATQKLHLKKLNGGYWTEIGRD